MYKYITKKISPFSLSIGGKLYVLLVTGGRELID